MVDRKQQLLTPDLRGGVRLLISLDLTSLDLKERFHRDVIAAVSSKRV